MPAAAQLELETLSNVTEAACPASARGGPYYGSQPVPGPLSVSGPGVPIEVNGHLTPSWFRDSESDLFRPGGEVQIANAGADGVQLRVGHSYFKFD